MDKYDITDIACDCGMTFYLIGEETTAELLKRYQWHVAIMHFHANTRERRTKVN